MISHFCHILNIFAIISFLFLTKIYHIKSLYSQNPIKWGQNKKISDIVSEKVNDLWCLYAESNYELILTMDPLYHLTIEATNELSIYLYKSYCNK